MAVKFLDNTGLGYFWSKIKAWCNATFAAITHNHASNAVNVMTGYNKPSSGSAIATSDSLNSAIGKLEAKVDAIDDSNVVHRIGDEDIQGIKTFFDRNLILKSLTIESGVAPSSNTYSSLMFEDKNGEWLGMLEFTQRYYGAYDIKLGCYKQDSSNTLPCLYLGYDGNGIAYSETQSTSELRTNGTDILTRDWIPKDTRIVHMSGNETIAGDKTLTGALSLESSSPDIVFYNTELTKGTNPASNMWNELLFCDKTGDSDSAYRIGQIAVRLDSDGKTNVELHAYNWVSGSTANSSIGIAYPKNGTPYTWAPTPATSDNSTKMATTAFVKAQGYLTSHQSLDSCVKTSGAQTVDDTKTFTASPEIKRGNPYIYFIETDQTRWTYANTTYQGLWFCDKNKTEMAGLIVLNYANECGIRIRTISKGTTYGDTYLEMNGANSGSVTKAFSPYPTKSCSLGNSSHLYTQLYAGTATISTSDEKEKSNIESIPDEILDAWEEVSFCSFQFNDALAQKGVSARIHSGLVSQHVYEIFNKHNLDGFRYAFLCRDQGEAIDRDEKQPDGTIHHFHEDAYDNWGIRYEEALCIEAAYQRRKNKILENRISELERQVSDMLILLQNLTNGNG